jgi:protocatechuate 3,4-dioxygenase beta subunit
MSAMSVSVIESSETSGVDITVPSSAESASVSGTITKPGGGPFNGVSVSLQGADGYSGSYSTSTDSNGDYTRTGIPPGTYIVAVSESNTPPFYYTGTYDFAAADRLELVPGEVETGIDIQTIDKQLAALSGTVRDGMGNPIDEVEIQLSGNSTYYSTFSSSDGTYLFPAVFPQAAYFLSAAKSGYFPTEVANLSIPPIGDVTRDLVLNEFEPGSVAGKVRDASGYPLDQVSIEIVGTNVDYELSTYSDPSGTTVLTSYPP